MKLYRYMSFKEYEDVIKGKPMVNTNSFEGKRTNSKGFCFLGEKTQVEVYDEKIMDYSPLECFEFLKGIVSKEILVEFEVVPEFEKNLKHGYGGYTNQYTFQGMIIREFSVERYNKDVCVPKRVIIFPGFDIKEDLEDYLLSKGNNDSLERLANLVYENEFHDDYLRDNFLWYESNEIIKKLYDEQAKDLFIKGGKSMSKIMMEYPIDPIGENQMYDGQNHEIQPLEFHRLPGSGRAFYVMSYLEGNQEMITVVTRIGNVWAKVPLDSYAEINQLIEQGQLIQEDIQINDDIKLAETISSKELLDPNNQTQPKDEPIYKFSSYIPTTDNMISVKGKSYRSDFVRIDQNGDKIYQFSKRPSFDMYDEKASEGLKSTSGEGKYKFLIDVPEGTVGKTYSLDADGNVVCQKVLIIPGKHEYTVFYSKYKSNYDNAVKANKMRAKDDNSEFRGMRYDEIRESVFQDAGNGKIPTEFYGFGGLIKEKNVDDEDYDDR